MDSGIVFSDDPDVVLNDTLAQVLPALVCLCVGRLPWSRIEDVGAAEVRAEELSYLGPSHEFVDGKQLEQLRIEGDLGVAGVFVDAVQEIRLLVVIRREDNIVDDSLQALGNVSCYLALEGR